MPASPISRIQIFASKSIVASGNATYDIDLERENAEGFFSLQIQLTGDGTAKGEYLLSNNNVDFIEPTGATDIFTGFTKTSGPSSDGKDMYAFEPMLANWIRIKITETGGANGIVVSAWAAVQ